MVFYHSSRTVMKELRLSVYNSIKTHEFTTGDFDGRITLIYPQFPII